MSRTSSYPGSALVVSLVLCRPTALACTNDGDSRAIGPRRSRPLDPRTTQRSSPESVERRRRAPATPSANGNSGRDERDIHRVAGRSSVAWPHVPKRYSSPIRSALESGETAASRLEIYMAGVVAYYSFLAPSPATCRVPRTPCRRRRQAYARGLGPPASEDGTTMHFTTGPRAVSPAMGWLEASRSNSRSAAELAAGQRPKPFQLHFSGKLTHAG